MHGTIAIEVKEGVCRGRIDTAGALAQWVDTRAASTRLAMARVARRDEGVHVFAFVQPWGLSPLRLRLGKDGSLAADGDIAGTAVQLSAPAPKPASAAGH